MAEATTTITAPLGSTFTHSAWVEGDTPGVYDVEVGPRLTYRRVLAGQVNKGDVLMDAFGRPSLQVTGRRKNTRSVSLTLDETDQQSFGVLEIVNVFVSSEPLSTDRHTVVTHGGHTWRPLALHYGPGAPTTYVRTDTEDVPHTPIVATYAEITQTA